MTQPDRWPSKLMRVLLPLREMVLILALALGAALMVLGLIGYAAFMNALGEAVGGTPAPEPAVTECVGEVPC